MNHIYRLVWSRVANSWVAVAEGARGKGKTKTRARKLAVKLSAAALSASVISFSLSPPAYAANAADASIATGNGSAVVTTAGTTTTINQASQRVVIDWTRLSTAVNEALVFNQPNASAIALNRITGTSPSTFLGSLSANGQVYILNPNGVLFGSGSTVNVGGLVASTMSMDPTAFMNGSTTFKQDPNATGDVVNQGTLTATGGGYIALLGKTVRNDGTINAPLGTVALGAGSNITLTFSGNSLVHMQVDESVFNTLAQNGGLIQADGGVVVMTAGAANSLLASVVNNTGTVEARTIQNHEGTITLLGGMETGTVNVDGTLDASAQNGGNGGAIETSAAAVNVTDSAKIDTRAPQGLMGSWLIDPLDFTIAASGGNITGAALSAELKLANVTLDTVHTTGSAAGDINVNDAVNWSSDSTNASSSTLTLNAANNININAPITWGVSGTPGDATTTGALVMNATNIINIGAPMNAFWRAPLTMNTGPTSDATLSTLRFSLLPNAGGFAGAANFYSDAGVTAAGGAGLLAINGNNYTVISDVTPGSGVGVAGDTGNDSLQGIQNNLGGYYALGSNIDASATASWNGGAGFSSIGAGDGTTPSLMFSGVFDGLGHTVSSINIVDSTGIYSGLFGMIYIGSTIRNVGMVDANVTGDFVGALVGNNNHGTVTNSFATGVVTGNTNAGGLVGINTGRIDQSYANVSVTGFGNSIEYGGGGLVGTNYTQITNSYAIGNVRFNIFAGGLVGNNDNGSIDGSYATGTVSSPRGGVGGLVGTGNSFSSINNSYATGLVTGSIGIPYLGGLIGNNDGLISNSYSTGNIDTTVAYTHAVLGALVGINTGTITNSFYASDTHPSLTGIANTADVAGSVWGLNTAAMKNLANFTSATGTSNPTDHSGNGGVNPGWDFPGAGNGSGTTWFMYDGYTMPLLQSFLTPLTITANSVSEQYDGTPYSGNNGVTYSITPDLSLLLGTLGYGGSAQGAVDIGSYAITPGGFYSGQQGYMITFVNGSLSINSGQPTTDPNPNPNPNPNTATGSGFSGSTTAARVVAWVLSDQSSDQANSSDSLPVQTEDVGAGSVVTINLGGNGSTLQIQSDSGS
jgi:filamentous hemagglutinin family protein